MGLLKIIFILFLIYFIRRFFQLYVAMKKAQLAAELQMRQEQQTSQSRKTTQDRGSIVEADYKVVD